MSKKIVSGILLIIVLISLVNAEIAPLGTSDFDQWDLTKEKTWGDKTFWDKAAKEWPEGIPGDELLNQDQFDAYIQHLGVADKNNIIFNTPNFKGDGRGAYSLLNNRDTFLLQEGKITIKPRPERSGLFGFIDSMEYPTQGTKIERTLSAADIQILNQANAKYIFDEDGITIKLDQSFEFGKGYNGNCKFETGDSSVSFLEDQGVDPIKKITVKGSFDSYFDEKTQRYVLSPLSGVTTINDGESFIAMGEVSNNNEVYEKLNELKAGIGVSADKKMFGNAIYNTPIDGLLKKAQSNPEKPFLGITPNTEGKSGTSFVAYAPLNENGANLQIAEKNNGGSEETKLHVAPVENELISDVKSGVTFTKGTNIDNGPSTQTTTLRVPRISRGGITSDNDGATSLTLRSNDLAKTGTQTTTNDKPTTQTQKRIVVAPKAASAPASSVTGETKVEFTETNWLGEPITDDLNDEVGETYTQKTEIKTGENRALFTSENRYFDTSSDHRSIFDTEETIIVAPNTEVEVAKKDVSAESDVPDSSKIVTKVIEINSQNLPKAGELATSATDAEEERVSNSGTTITSQARGELTETDGVQSLQNSVEPLVEAQQLQTNINQESRKGNFPVDVENIEKVSSDYFNRLNTFAKQDNEVASYQKDILKYDEKALDVNDQMDSLTKDYVVDGKVISGKEAEYSRKLQELSDKGNSYVDERDRVFSEMISRLPESKQDENIGVKLMRELGAGSYIDYLALQKDKNADSQKIFDDYFSETVNTIRLTADVDSLNKGEYAFKSSIFDSFDLGSSYNTYQVRRKNSVTGAYDSIGETSIIPPAIPGRLDKVSAALPISPGKALAAIQETAGIPPVSGVEVSNEKISQSGPGLVMYPSFDNLDNSEVKKSVEQFYAGIVTEATTDNPELRTEILTLANQNFQIAEQAKHAIDSTEKYGFMDSEIAVSSVFEEAGVGTMDNTYYHFSSIPGKKDLPNFKTFNPVPADRIDLESGETMIFVQWSNKENQIATVFYQEKKGEGFKFVQDLDLTKKTVVAVWKPQPK